MALDAAAAASNTFTILFSLTPSVALESKHKLAFLLRVQNHCTNDDVARSGDLPPIFNGTAGVEAENRIWVATLLSHGGRGCGRIGSHFFHSLTMRARLASDREDQIWNREGEDYEEVGGRMLIHRPLSEP